MKKKIEITRPPLESLACVTPDCKLYRQPGQGNLGRMPNMLYRIPRSAAHVQVIKHRQNHRLQSIEIRYTHGSKKRIDQSLTELGYHVPNTSAIVYQAYYAIERRNGTARLMSKAQVRTSSRCSSGRP